MARLRFIAGRTLGTARCQVKLVCDGSVAGDAMTRGLRIDFTRALREALAGVGIGRQVYAAFFA